MRWDERLSTCTYNVPKLASIVAVRQTVRCVLALSSANADDQNSRTVFHSQFSAWTVYKRNF